ncbi:MAG TPA: hypothetical protein PKK06_17960 [Phycisphaerae bacterium]|nr:hypothetical protein [Phycisphaerae bacterium]HNU47005.1 hypothetical protein [Phycisphaerae bacterium]
MKDEVTSTCETCGASIYKQHIDSGIARYEGGKLLCAHCVEEYEQAHDLASSSVQVASDSIALEEDAERSAKSGGTQIHSFSTQTLGLRKAKSEGDYKRTIDPNQAGATRCRIFHAKLTDGALTFMADSINDWLDENPSVVIKHVTSTIGIFEGKVHAEPNLIITLLY